MKLELQVGSGWVDAGRSGKPWTYSTRPGESNNVFQLSFMENKGGKRLEPPPALQQIATAQAEQLGGTLVKSSSGECAYGTFGTAAATTQDVPHFQIWLISNGIHIITATHTCDVQPSAEETNQVQAAVASVRLVPDSKPKWKFW